MVKDLDFAAGGARIEGDFIVIRLAIDALPVAVEGMCDSFDEEPMRVTDAAKFARGVVEALNREEEDGTTPTHLMFDEAFRAALDDGSEGVDEGARCEECKKVLWKPDGAKMSWKSVAGVQAGRCAWTCKTCVAELEGKAS